MADETVFQKIASAVATYAPGLAGVLAATGVGAPIAGAVGAIGVLAKQFGLPDTATHDEVLAAVQADPEANLKLVQAEQAFQLASRDQDIKELQLRIGTITSAQQMNVEGIKATGKRDVNLMVMSWLGILVAVSVFGVSVYLSLLGKLDPVTATLIGNMTGIFLAKYSTVFDFWFGAGVDAAHRAQTSK